MNSRTDRKAIYENLDTSFVNLWSLLRNLTQRGFIGRVRVELENYSADIFLTGSSTPLVHEVDQVAGTDTLEEAALHRLVLRARETPGKISVFEGAEEAVAVQSITNSSTTNAATAAPRSNENDPIEPTSSEVLAVKTAEYFEANADEAVPPGDQLLGTASEPPWESDLSATISLGGELVGAIERGVNASGQDFGSLFDAVRLELADDYSFLDPMSQVFAYSNGVASLTHDVTTGIFVSGLSEALRRVVDKVAVGDRTRRVRERIAIELLSVARKHKDLLEHSAFRLQLDRIAGTKVI